MKVAKEAKLGMAVALVVGLLITVPLYAFGFVTATGSGAGGASGATPKAKSTSEVVQDFADAGLAVGDSWELADDPEWGTGMVPKTMDGATRFEIPGYKQTNRAATGDVYHFATAEDQKILSDYFGTMSKASGLFYVHVYETDGYMLKIDGAVPKDVADGYGNVFEKSAV